MKTTQTPGLKIPVSQVRFLPWALPQHENQVDLQAASEANPTQRADSQSQSSPVVSPIVLTAGLERRFWAKVGRPADPLACWTWRAYITTAGYPRLRSGGRGSPQVLATRVSYAIHKGDPERFLVCHTCDVPTCTNPAHLFLGTNADNMADMVAKGRSIPQRGSLGNNSKITEADVIEMRRLYWVERVQQKEIRAQFGGLSKGGVSNIVNGVTWTHVAMPGPALAKCGVIAPICTVSREQGRNEPPHPYDYLGCHSRTGKGGGT